MDKKWYRISVLVNVVQLFIIIVLGYFIWFNEKPIPYDINLIEEQKKQLHMENTILLHGLKVNEEKIKAFEREIDSLKTVPEKINKQYAKKYKKVDAYTVSQLTHELDSAYTNDNR